MIDRATLEIVAVYASDWGMYSDQVSRDHPFQLVRGWVVGVLVGETPDQLVIAHHSFTDGDLRHVTTIPKVNVLARWDFFIDEDQADGGAEMDATTR